MRDCTRAADGVSFDTDRCDWADRVLGVRVGVVSDEERVRRDGGDGEDVVVGVRDIGRRVCGGEFSDRDLVRGGDMVTTMVLMSSLFGAHGLGYWEMYKRAKEIGKILN